MTAGGRKYKRECRKEGVHEGRSARGSAERREYMRQGIQDVVQAGECGREYKRQGVQQGRCEHGTEQAQEGGNARGSTRRETGGWEYTRGSARGRI